MTRRGVETRTRLVDSPFRRLVLIRIRSESDRAPVVKNNRRERIRSDLWILTVCAGENSPRELKWSFRRTTDSRWAHEPESRFRGPKTEFLSGDTLKVAGSSQTNLSRTRRLFSARNIRVAVVAAAAITQAFCRAASPRPAGPNPRAPVKNYWLFKKHRVPNFPTSLTAAWSFSCASRAGARAPFPPVFFYPLAGSTASAATGPRARPPSLLVIYFFSVSKWRLTGVHLWINVRGLMCEMIWIVHTRCEKNYILCQSICLSAVLSHVGTCTFHIHLYFRSTFLADDHFSVPCFLPRGIYFVNNRRMCARVCAVPRVRDSISTQRMDTVTIPVFLPGIYSSGSCRWMKP